MGQDIRTYRARSMQEAIELVRQDLGPDASVLHTRQVKTGALPWTRSSQIEVTASAAIQAPGRFTAEEITPTRRVSTRTVKAAVYQQHTSGEREPEPETPPQPQPPTNDEPLWDFEAYQSRVQSVVQRDLLDAYGTASSGEVDLSRHESRVSARRSKETHVASPTAPQDPQPNTEPPSPASPRVDGRPALGDRIHMRLLEAEFDDAIAREFAERVVECVGTGASMKAATGELRRLIEDEITPAGAITAGNGPRVVALVGPTGVGKTTTIAKLAADFRLREQRKVGLITFDTYRIAAVDQLRTYAEIIDLPMQVVGSLEELPAALEAMSEMDIVLMDTAGRSPQDEVRIRELRSALQQARVDEVHLVLSCTSGGRSLRGAAERFGAINPDSLILTKLDEAETFGGLFGMLRDANLPISHVTDGQAVPEDIQVASSRRLADRIVEAI